MQAKGSKGRLVLDFETTFGQDPSTKAGIIMPYNTLNLSAKQNQNETRTLTGRRDKTEPILGNIDVSGSAEVPIDAIATGYWLKGLFGAPDTTDNQDGTYTHVFKISDTQPSMVIEKGFTDIGRYMKYNGVKINGLSFNFGGDGELTMSLNLVGVDETLSSSEYDASATSVTLLRFNNFQASVKEGGVVLGNVTDGSLNINAGLDTNIYVLGGEGRRASLPEGQMSISGSITTLFEDDSLLNKAINGTESSLEISFVNGENSLTFKIPELKYAREGIEISGPAGVKYTAPFNAYFSDASEDSSIVVTLTNTKASY